MCTTMALMTTHTMPRVCDLSATRRFSSGITMMTRQKNVSRRDVSSHVSTGLYDDETFAAMVLGKFPDQNETADTEEARVLWENGYVALDVRADSEIEFEGKVPNPARPGVSHGDRVRLAPLVKASRVYDATAGKKVYRQEPVDVNLFVREVNAACSNDGGAESKLLVLDDVGGVRARKAAEVLICAGITNVVVVRGGANAWKAAWDGSMRRRQLPGSFSRGFDSPMFADSNVVAESFGVSGDDTVWVC